jgi:hypothetical protein
VWSKFRELRSCLCYYEPLHERIAGLSLETVKADPEIELTRALRHPLPKKHYFAEYARLLRAGKLQYSPDLAYDRYLLKPGQADERLRGYLEGLISSASASNRRAVLCFCRSQMRSAWMKETFGGFHVAQIRNPADQWASFKVDSYFISNMIVIALRLRDLHPGAFVHINTFEAFAKQLSMRPQPPPIITEYFIPQFANHRDCLDIFLVLWFASALQTIGWCDFLLDIDQLSTDDAYRSATLRWFDSIGCSVDLSDCCSPSSANLDPAFERAVTVAASAVRSNASSLVVTRAEVLRERLASLSPLSRRILSLAFESQ